MIKKFIQKIQKIPFTKNGYDQLIAEREKYRSERPEAVNNIRSAREMGDLSENGYYKAARTRLSGIDANLRRLDRIIRAAVIVVSSKNGTVDIGSTVRVQNNIRTVSYTIVGGYESDPLKHTVSHLSPIGKALMGKNVHDIVSVHTPRGDIKYTIIDIS